ncbi:MAG: M20/M25/M40 family metallo-hydrolase [Ignavibacterium sp.]|nr:M20/M25/M40 family metallo-hydrolase [Ignavibacterium sp.]
MKKSLHLFIVSLFILQSSIFSQSPQVQQIINSVNQDSLIQYVKELSGVVPTMINGTMQTILSRNKNQPGNALAETYIKQKLQSYGLTTTIQSFSTTGKNVYAVQPGTEFPNKKYIVCAHYDDMPSGTIAPGADDNGSGTAAVIEAARIFSQQTFPYTIVYALWDEEEQGLVGSAYYATQAFNAGDSILGVINMDMIAYDGNNDGVCNIHNRPVGSSVELYNKMVEINTQYAIGLTIVSYNPGITASDHASFWNKGYGAILLIEDDNDFHPQYHTINDNLSYYNQPYFVKNSKLAFATLATIALNLTLDISHTPIASMTTSEPITASAFVSSGLQIGTGSLAPRLYYRTKTSGGTFSNFIEVTGTPTESGNFNFNIPALALGTVCQYYIAVQDANSSIVKTLPTGGGGFNPPGSTPPPTFYQFFVAPLTVAMYDEANNITNWTSTSGWNTTTAKYVSAPSSFTDSPSGNYLANVTSSLRYNNQVGLTNVLGAVLEFDTQWDIETDYDYGQIQLSTNNGSTWIALAGQYTNPSTGSFQPPNQPVYDGTQLTWVHESIDISAYAEQQIAIRFYFASDYAVQKDGWYVDNVKVSVYNGIIPVELVTFTSSIINNTVSLNWITASELNNSGFEIEKSTNNVNWDKIGFVPGNGTSTEVHNYSFIDQNPFVGTSYYRLKQIDFDGTSEYANIVEVVYGTVSEFALEQNYPNPFNPSTKIKYSIASVETKHASSVQLKIYDVLGNEVATLVNEEKTPGNYEVIFDASKLSSGVYLYTIKSGIFVQTRKMLLMK